MELQPLWFCHRDLGKAAHNHQKACGCSNGMLRCQSSKRDNRLTHPQSLQFRGTEVATAPILNHIIIVIGFIGYRNYFSLFIGRIK